MTGKWSQIDADRYEFRKDDPDSTVIGEVLKQNRRYRARYRNTDNIWMLVTDGYSTVAEARKVVEAMLASPDAAPL